MNYYLYRFTPRPDFRATMTEAEAAVMQEHFAYWQALADNGTALVVGPVDDPAGPWGLAVIKVESAAEAESIRAADPVAVNELGPVVTLPFLSTIVPS